MNDSGEKMLTYRLKNELFAGSVFNKLEPKTFFLILDSNVACIVVDFDAVSAKQSSWSSSLEF